MKKKNKKSMKKTIIYSLIIGSFIIMLAIEIFLLITVGTLISVCDFHDFYTPLTDPLSIPDNEVTNISKCANYSAVMTSYCLNEMFKEIYVYNVTTDYEYDNFSIIDKYIRQYGGDCHESATWFVKAAEELGVYSEYVDFTLDYDNESDEDYAYRYLHAVAIISDKDAYCLLDQGRTTDCYEFDTDKNESDYKVEYLNFITK